MKDTFYKAERSIQFRKVNGTVSLESLWLKYSQINWAKDFVKFSSLIRVKWKAVVTAEGPEGLD